MFKTGVIIIVIINQIYLTHKLLLPYIDVNLTVSLLNPPQWRNCKKCTF